MHMVNVVSICGQKMAALTIVCENSLKFKMASIMKRSQIFEIGENSVKLQSLLFHLSPHLDLYVLPVLNIASEFEFQGCSV